MELEADVMDDLNRFCCYSFNPQRAGCCSCWHCPEEGRHLQDSVWYVVFLFIHAAYSTASAPTTSYPSSFVLQHRQLLTTELDPAQ